MPLVIVLGPDAPVAGVSIAGLAPRLLDPDRVEGERLAMAQTDAEPDAVAIGAVGLVDAGRTAGRRRRDSPP